MSYPIRPMTPSDWPAFLEVLMDAYNTYSSPERNERFKRLFDFERTLAAFDGETLIGGTGTFEFDMAVPGGTTAVAGVTAVGVLSSHRRRGVLSSLMRRQLTDLAERGEAVAALYASESSIYGRYGYGLAAEGVAFTIDRRDTAFSPHAPSDPALRLRIVNPDGARNVFEKVFEAVRVTRPGMYARSTPRWDGVLADDEQARHGMGPLRGLVAEDDTGPRGYALFRAKEGFSVHDIFEGELHLYDLHATDPAAYAAVWRGVLDRDLIATFKVPTRPADDPIRLLFNDPRRLRAVAVDDLWIRLADVRRALTERAYAAPVDVAIGIDDPVCPWNTGTWRLSADTTGATCEPTRAPADVTLPVNALGAAYLGGTSLHAWNATGAAAETREGALRALSTAMSWDVKPWAGLIF
ncbi:GNAT family N-acetyltransferase [Sinosporangium siamense]|uniref:UPF0256 protein n=1 Tax=Sinosporangium siamense TaxID=1367973 RepID=A0A919RDH1_9ACTN|nr:GNAT family N-acetyltransferase [Sinosporangium siamense]GII91687.1 UPF0256 protein [Sinosporangium siamense]